MEIQIVSSCWEGQIVLLLVANCSNSRVAGFREMIPEAGSDFLEVIPSQKNFMGKNGKNNKLSAIEIYKNRQFCLKQTSDNIQNCCKSFITFIQLKVSER